MNDESRYKNPGHELTDAKVSGIFWAGAGLVLLSVVAFVLIWVLMKIYDTSRSVPEQPEFVLEQPERLPPQPRLQVKPEVDIEVFKAREDSLLTTYGWVVKEAGVVRIPVERAKELSLKRGFPVRPDYGNWGETGKAEIGGQ